MNNITNCTFLLCEKENYNVLDNTFIFQILPGKKCCLITAKKLTKIILDINHEKKQQIFIGFDRLKFSKPSNQLPCRHRKNVLTVFFFPISIIKFSSLFKYNLSANVDYIQHSLVL